MFLKNIETAIKSHPVLEQKAAEIREMRARMAAQTAAMTPMKAPARKKPAKSKKSR